MKNWNDTNKERMIKQINETYQFDQHHTNAEDAAHNVRIGYENDPAWFSFVVDDKDAFEEDVKIIINKLYCS